MSELGSPARPYDILVVGAGPTGIAIGAEARRVGLEAIVIDRGALTQSLLDFPTFMTFFTTREKLEIGGVPLAIPDEKPTRRQALTYYRAVVEHWKIRLALHEEVLELRPVDGLFAVKTRGEIERERWASAVALATGYFDNPRRLGVEGEALPFVHHRYLEPYRHFRERVVVVGGGNTAVETALDLWRAGAKVTLVHRGSEVKGSVKYWLKPDFENRVAEGALEARFETRVQSFSDSGVQIIGPAGEERLEVDAAYVLIGYRPDVDLERRCGVAIEPDTLVPAFNVDSCESNVPGLYVAGTLQAGVDTNRIFIENSRHHSELIIRHLSERLGRASDPLAHPIQV